MRHVTYAGQTFVTSDDMATALIEFAASTALNGGAEPVSIPGLDDDGAPITVDLVIGPSSEVISLPTGGDDRRVDHASAVDDLDERTAVLRGQRNPQALPLDEPLPSADGEL